MTVHLRGLRRCDGRRWPPMASSGPWGNLRNRGMGYITYLVSTQPKNLKTCCGDPTRPRRVTRLCTQVEWSKFCSAARCTRIAMWCDAMRCDAMRLQCESKYMNNTTFLSGSTSYSRGKGKGTWRKEWRNAGRQKGREKRKRNEIKSAAVHSKILSLRWLSCSFPAPRDNITLYWIMYKYSSTDEASINGGGAVRSNRKARRKDQMKAFSCFLGSLYRTGLSVTVVLGLGLPGRTSNGRRWSTRWASNATAERWTDTPAHTSRRRSLPAACSLARDGDSFGKHDDVRLASRNDNQWRFNELISASKASKISLSNIGG